MGDETDTTTTDNAGGGDDGATTKASDEATGAAERRAQDAERRAEAAEDKARKQEDVDKRKARDAEIKDIDAAKKAIAEADARATAAAKRADEAESRYRARTEKRVASLPQETQDKLGIFRDDLAPDKWEALVDMEFERAGATAGTDTTDTADATGVPPAGTMGGRRHAVDAAGRKLHPKSVEILDELGVDTTAAKQALDVVMENEGGQKKGRFVYPQKLLRKQLRERAAQPQQLTLENYQKIFKR